MKARVPLLNARQRKLAAEEIERQNKEYIEKMSNDLTRRIIKTVIYVMYREFGWGVKRVTRLFNRFTETLERSDEDMVFWEHIDRLVIDELGLPFERDYTDNGRVVSESDIARRRSDS